MDGSALLVLHKEAGLRMKTPLYERKTIAGLGSFGIGEESGAGRGEEALEEEGGGDLIDDVFAVETAGAASRARGMAGCIEEGVGVVGGEALVE
jgi:hypothetical protein